MYSKKLSNIYFSILIIILKITYSFYSKQAKIKNFFFDKDNEITIVINGTGEQRILGYISEIPSQIYLYDVRLAEEKIVYNFTSELNTIRMIWDSPLSDCNRMFYGLDNILEIDFSKFDSSQVTDMSDMFYRCASLTSIDFSNMNTSLVTNFNWMFSNCYNLKSLDLRSFNTSLVTSMVQMFCECESLEELYLSSFDTSLVTNFDHMFFKCYKLKSLDLRSFNTSLVTSMYRMFCECESLETLDLSSFDTSLVTDMVQTFLGCSSLISLDLKNFNTSSVETMTQMFRGCKSLESLDLSNFITPNVIQIEEMFGGCNSLVSLDISNFDTSKVENMGYMFYCCYSLKSLNLSNFDTSNVIYFNNMFTGCKSLENLDIRNFNTYSALTTNNMFFDCQSLKSLDISHFNTSKVQNMNGMFLNCLLLASLELGNFDTTSVTDMSLMFYGCNSLISLNLNSFKISNVTSCDDMFFNLNISKFCINSDIDDKIKSQLSTFTEANCSELCYITSPNKYIPEKNKCINNCINDETFIFEYDHVCYSECPNGTHLINNSNLCEKDLLICTNYINYEQTGCLDSIPLGYYVNDTEKKTLDKCDIKCSNCTIDSLLNNLCISCNNSAGYYRKYNDSLNENEYINCYNEQPNGYYLDNEEKIYNPCYSNCKACTGKGNIDNHQCSECYTDYILNNGNCESFNYNEVSEEKVTINNFNFTYYSNSSDEIVKNIKKEILNGELLSNLINGNEKNIVIKEDKAIYSISQLDNQEDYKFNLTLVDIGECEDVLREKYNLSQNEPLFIFKRECFIDGLLIPIIEYEIYSNKIKTELNMDYCHDIKININIPISINENDLFKYDPSSPYYMDLCYPHSTEDNTDIILSDRKNEYNNNNMSLCESNCEYTNYNPQTKTVTCECEVKKKISLINDIVNNKDALLNKFVDIKNTANIKVMKCYYTLFTKNGLKLNIGSYFLFFVIFINLILMIYFIAKGYYKFINYIKKDVIIYEEKENKSNYNNLDDKSKKKDNKRNRKKSIDIGNTAEIQIYQQVKEIKKMKAKKNGKKKGNILKKKKNKNLFNSNATKNNNININSSLNTEKVYLDEKNVLKYNDFELNNLTYEKALKLDKRSFFQYYLSLLKYHQQIIFTFYTYTDYNSKIIKICLFLFLFSLYYVVNSLFFNNETIHVIYVNKGVYNFIFEIPKILYSSIISSLIKVIISYFSLTEKNIVETKKEKKNENIVKLFKCLSIKFISFYIMNFLFLIFFWYYLACFCVVYKNSQIHVIKDSLISFSISQLYPLGISLVTCIVRITSLRNNKEGLYKFSKILQLF